VPIILATFPLLAGIPQATMIFNLVFFIVLTSVLLQGTSIPLVARWLKVDEPLQRRLDASPVWNAPTGLKSGLVEMTIPEYSVVVGKRLIDIGLPESTLVILIGRRGQCFVPDGSTVLETNDSLLVFSDQGSSFRLRAMIDTRRSGAEERSSTDQGGVVAP
jgi:cell volume regulation protein A